MFLHIPGMLKFVKPSEDFLPKTNIAFDLKERFIKIIKNVQKR